MVSGGVLFEKVASNVFPTFGELKSLGINPRVYPNGFLQLSLGDRYRLHIWPSEEGLLPCRETGTMIHDYGFSFRSYVFFGALRESLYDVELDTEGAYHIYRVPQNKFYGQMSLLRESDRKYRIVLLKDMLYGIGQGYVRPKGMIHEIVPDGLTVTIIEFLELDREMSPRILCPVSEVPDNSFQRDCVPQERLWELVDLACQHIHAK